MAVINALGPLVKTRHTISSKIINSLLLVDIVSISQNTADPAKTQLQVRSLSKTLRIQLSHFLRTNASGPLANKIDQYLRTHVVNSVVSDGEEVSRKRPATEEFDQLTKKQRSEPAPSAVINPAIWEAFVLDPGNPLALYDAQAIPLPIVVQTILKTMEIIPLYILDDKLNGVRARLLTLPATATNEATNGDFDDYDPEAAIEIDYAPDEPVEEAHVDELANQTFELPEAQNLNPQALQTEFHASIDRILQSVRTMDKMTSHRAGLSTKAASLDSLAITEWDKEAWIIILSRLSARGLTPPSATNTLGSSLRERLFEYIMINFREHMDLTISWLTEEWYNDTLTTTPESSGNYMKWATRIFDNILPFIEAKDARIFIRFLGELPLVLPSHVARLKTLCLDPERQKLGFAAIRYLLLLRPPTRGACVELCVDLYQNRRSLEDVLTVDADTKKAAADILKKWAPGTVEEAVKKEGLVVNQEGVEVKVEESG